MRSILLVDDDPVDVKSVRRAFDQIGAAYTMETASNGEEALRYLRDQEEPPSLILLDLNMPWMNGVEFLDAYKSDARLRHIPSVVLTTSNEAGDRLATYRGGVAEYIVKPIEFDDFREALRSLDQYWNVCELP